jgi:hypothetical protein
MSNSCRSCGGEPGDKIIKKNMYGASVVVQIKPIITESVGCE